MGMVHRPLRRSFLKMSSHTTSLWCVVQRAQLVSGACPSPPASGELSCTGSPMRVPNPSVPELKACIVNYDIAIRDHWQRTRGLPI